MNICWKNAKSNSFMAMNSKQNYLTLETLEVDNTIILNKSGNPDPIECYYKINDSQWTLYNVGSQITLSNIGDKVSFKCTTTTFSKFDHYYFSSTKDFNAFGNIMSLVHYNSVMTDYQYNGLFYLCKTLRNIDLLQLPVTTLAENCYYQMFYGCDGLTSLPSELLPATSLAEYCYNRMFSTCKGLTTLPSGLLPATSLACHCYDSMFESCDGLTSLPSELLPATSLAESCYSYMFDSCYKLENSQLLPATTLIDYCYEGMFLYCCNFKTIDVKFTKWENATDSWLYDVSPTGTFYKPEALSIQRGDGSIPNGWTVVNKY